MESRCRTIKSDRRLRPSIRRSLWMRPAASRPRMTLPTVLTESCVSAARRSVDGKHVQVSLPAWSAIQRSTNLAVAPPGTTRLVTAVMAWLLIDSP